MFTSLLYLAFVSGNIAYQEVDREPVLGYNSHYVCIQKRLQFYVRNISLCQGVVESSAASSTVPPAVSYAARKARPGEDFDGAFKCRVQSGFGSCPVKAVQDALDGEFSIKCPRGHHVWIDPGKTPEEDTISCTTAAQSAQKIALIEQKFGRVGLDEELSHRLKDYSGRITDYVVTFDVTPVSGYRP